MSNLYIELLFRHLFDLLSAFTNVLNDIKMLNPKVHITV